MTRRWRRQALALGALVATDCILPDREIEFESEFSNPGAVRIVEPAPRTADMIELCGADDNEVDNPEFCPQVPVGALRTGLVQLRDTSGSVLPFCVCPGEDTRRLPEFFVYAEDPDRVRDGPADTLHAAALLDLDPASDAPQNYIAYEEHLQPGGEGELFDSVDDLPGFAVPGPQREDNGLWRFRFGKDGGVGTDLCNDDNGDKLEPGLHTLQIMVTDRPFFQPPRLDDDGMPLDVLAPPQFGMPDLAAGATFAVANYVFECVGVDTMGAAACDCAETVGP